MLLVCLLPFTALKAANAIDSLKTDEQVQSFMRKLDKRFTENNFVPLRILPDSELQKRLDCNSIARQWNLKSWEKADFNQDGRTDMLVTTYWYNFDVWAVMDQGQNRFKLIPVSGNAFENCELAKPVIINRQAMLLFYAIKVKPGKTPRENTRYGQTDTLIYKYGGFVEYTARPANYKVKSVTLQTSPCFGSCPVFSMSIDAGGEASYHNEGPGPDKGLFKGKIAPERLDEILALVDYIHLRQLKDNYRVPWTDDQTVKLTVQFKDGSTKEITDYGLQGTFGLAQLYALITALRDSQAWQR